MLEPVE